MMFFADKDQFTEVPSKELPLAYMSYVWRVTLGAEGRTTTKEILMMTEEPIPGPDFGSIVKIHLRAYATELLVPIEAVSMRSMSLLGQAYGATKETSQFVDPEMSRDELGEVRLSEGLIQRVQAFSDKLENSGPPAPLPTEGAADQFNKWQTMAFSNVGRPSGKTEGHFTVRSAPNNESGTVAAGDVIIEPKKSTIEVDNIMRPNGKVETLSGELTDAALEILKNSSSE